MRISPTLLFLTTGAMGLPLSMWGADSPIPAAEPNSVPPSQSSTVPAAAPRPAPSPALVSTAPILTAERSGTPDPWWTWVPDHAIHAQSTMIMLKHPSFYHRYDGTNSLQSQEGRKTSLTATIFAGMRLWPGGEVYVDPEIAGGEGPSNVLGVAGAINGETPRVASPEPEPYLARWFLRQTIGMGGDSQTVPDAPNQLPGTRLSNRWQVTIGKFAANDIFDNNTYSHDPRSQFSNWALWENGAWDYPADTRGYTIGGALELFYHGWVYRLGAFEEPKVANGQALDGHLTQAWAGVGEIERDYTIDGHPGAVRVLFFGNRSHAGKYQDALALSSVSASAPDVTATRQYRMKYGFGINFEQELASSIGLFTRLGWNDGHSESWAFTEIDRTASCGIDVRGTRWHRPEDTLACAIVVNGLSKPHRDYLSAGGYGFIIGDGALNYRTEQVLEAYYYAKISPLFAVSPSFQYVVNPGYNHDRGPVWFTGLRAHVDL